MNSPIPFTRDLVLIGGGHAHALVLRKWGMRPLPGARVTVINPGPTAPYTGMLPGHVAGHYDREDLEIDLVRLARFAGARLVLGSVTGLDRQAKRVHVESHPPIRYDVASFDVGITSDMPSLPGFSTHGIAAKPLDQFASAWISFCSAVADGTKAPQIAVIGGGIAGIELSLAMHHRLEASGHRPKVSVIERADALTEVSGGTRAILFEELRRRSIKLLEHCAATEVSADGVHTAKGMVPSAFTVGAAGALPRPLMASLGLPTQDGYLLVDGQLRSPADPTIYGAGDCVHLTESPRPKAGVYAVRAAPVLFNNLRADLSGAQRKTFDPQGDYLKLISLGAQDAVGDKWGSSFRGGWVWKIKDRIDRAFMDKLSTFPRMEPPLAPPDRALDVTNELGHQPLCGGCGSKVAAPALERALRSIPGAERPDVLSSPGDDAAILAMGDDWQVVSTDHLRAFTNDPVILTRIAAVHAMGDIWAMGADPQALLAQTILPRMAEPLAEATLSEMLATASDVARAAGAELVGGHTTQGAEMTVGFTVTGLRKSYPITQSGAEPGDALLLTKPIGTGVLLAGEMQGKAKGVWVTEALSSMSRLLAPEAAILSGAKAMTDVTGFGLLGHLASLCKASGVGAELSLAAVPFYAGAETLAAEGFRSTLWGANRNATETTVPDTPRADLLFDPQTAGGLLAAVPEGDAQRLLDELLAAGVPAARVGDVSAGSPGDVQVSED